MLASEFLIPEWGIVAVAIAVSILLPLLLLLRWLRIDLKGIPARATLEAVKRSWGWHNDDPVLELRMKIDLPGQPPYEVTVRQAIPVWLVADFKPGIYLPVKVDPKNQRRVRVDLGSTGDSLDLLPPTGQLPEHLSALTRNSRQGKTAAELLASGRRTVATVMNILDTGNTIASTGGTSSVGLPPDTPSYLFRVNYRLADGTATTAAWTQPAPRALASTVSPGMTLPIAYDESNPTRGVVVDIDQWGGPSFSVVNPSPGAGLSPERLARLETLGDLHERGVLTDVEFETKKARLLDGSS